MGKLSPVDPREYLPSRAHPEHRSRRKEIEKEHPFGWKEPLVLGLLGIGLAWNIEKQVQKHEERKDKEEQEGKDREERRRHRREQQIRGGTFDPRNEDRDSESRSRHNRDRRSSRAGGGGSDHGSDRSVARDTVDLERGRRSRRDRVQSVDMGRREGPRYIEDDPYSPYYQRYPYERGHDDDRRDRDRDYYTRRSRRDSW
ncbi:hypothetical protein F5Y06DRAFT_82063 [Hypoxylon sp. FL0890]|nr:hypothetical protein F5Y06DRAFT_82063 [Hypoxylon sp. FL0890]